MATAFVFLFQNPNPCVFRLSMVKRLKCSCHGDTSLNIREKSSIGNEHIIISITILE